MSNMFDFDDDLKLLNLKEVADILGVSETKVYRLIYNYDDFPAYKIGREYRVSPSELSDWIKKTNKNKSIKEKDKRYESIDFDHDKYLSLVEAARVFHISERRMSVLYKVEGFPYIKKGNSVLIPIEELNDWISNNLGKTINI